MTLYVSTTINKLLLWSAQKRISRQMLRFCFWYNYKNNANILFQFKLLLFFLGGVVDKFKSAATESTAVSESNGFCGPDSFLIQNTNISLISISCSFHEFWSNHRKCVFFFAGNFITGSISRRQREKCCQRPGKEMIQEYMFLTKNQDLRSWF